MKEAAKSSKDKPSQIFSSIVADLPADVRAALPTEHVCKEVMQAVRRSDLPLDPKQLSDLEIPETWSSTSSGQPFLIYDNGADAGSRVIIFASPDQLRELARADMWFMDGNFAMSPRLFSQLYVIRVPIGQAYVSTVYALLQHKNQQCYQELLQALLDKCNEVLLFPDPHTIVVDFETAVINSIHTVLGSNVRVQGCYYHFTQATWRKVQELGLVALYNSDGDFKKFVRMMDAVPLLPLDKVHEGLSHLRDICPQEAERLLDYFDSTYVSGTFRRVTTNDLRVALRRQPPRYPKEVWNVHNATIQNCPRTNNICEGWNSKFYHLVNGNHPTIWRLISALKKEEASVATVIAQDAVGVHPKKRVKRVYVDLQRKLKNLCQDVVSNRKTIPEFLSAAGHCINAKGH